MQPVSLDRFPEPTRAEVFPALYEREFAAVSLMDPPCGCGCGERVSVGYEYDGEMFASRDCVIRMMINEGWLKEVG